MAGGDRSDNDDISQVIEAALDELRNETTTSPTKIDSLARSGSAHDFEVRGSPIVEKYPIDERSMPHVEAYVKKIMIDNSTAIKEVLRHEGMRQDLVKKSTRELLSKAFDLASMSGFRSIESMHVSTAFDTISANCRGIFPFWN
jgi:hypothetical protein